MGISWADVEDVASPRRQSGSRGNNRHRQAKQAATPRHPSSSSGNIAVRILQRPETAKAAGRAATDMPRHQRTPGSCAPSRSVDETKKKTPQRRKGASADAKQLVDTATGPRCDSVETVVYTATGPRCKSVETVVDPATEPRPRSMEAVAAQASTGPRARNYRRNIRRRAQRKAARLSRTQDGTWAPRVPPTLTSSRGGTTSRGGVHSSRTHSDREEGGRPTKDLKSRKVKLSTTDRLL
ncbi:hypothetical protein THAOC_25095 [Thalassiosira oceanica]|uniref:Uncharacterized protein n=1 Tax=Thalassiosira oceanica TaxID=159749 RepID=K0S2L5_THAOC|nr:hypothetical protein THAOC_25095 [Thalassiosira oceanica]|eukprot:EJK55196.1 hypothetical protein THAOC_25095 [Thalassiosira oceanica]